MDAAPKAQAPDTTSGPPKMPTWVKAFLIGFAVLAVIVIVALLVGGGHGPWRHSP